MQSIVFRTGAIFLHLKATKDATKKRQLKRKLKLQWVKCNLPPKFISQYTNTAFPVPDGFSQYLLLAVSFPSLAVISRHERAGNSCIEPKGAGTGKNVENKVFVSADGKEKVKSTRE